MLQSCACKICCVFYEDSQQYRIGIRKLPMILEVDNKGAVDICNSWTVGGRTRHVEVKMYFLRELKEQGLVKVIWKKGTEMSADSFTKNSPGPLRSMEATSMEKMSIT